MYNGSTSYGVRSKRKLKSEREGKARKLHAIDPKPSDLTKSRPFWGCTCICCKILGRLLVRGERLIKLGDIWFSAKFMYVERRLVGY